MNKNVILWLIIIGCSLEISAKTVKENKNSEVMSDNRRARILSRHKRYLAFPEGSSFAVSFCATYGAIGDPQYTYLSWALNWAIAYELPNETWIIDHRKEISHLSKPVIQRRHRRDLFRKLEVTIDRMGYNGRQCILRALCESTQYFHKRGSNMLEELIRTIFSLPKSKVLPFEHITLQEYDLAHRKGKNKVYCGMEYPGCSFSLIQLAFGAYSNPINYM